MARLSNVYLFVALIGLNVLSCSATAPVQRVATEQVESGSASFTQEAVTPRAARADWALSLGRLQKAVAAGDSEAKTLGGLNRFRYALITSDGDPILVGEIDRKRPRAHIDDLVVALRNAFGLWRVNEPIGCTIDPRDGESDPWGIQTVKVFGGPANTLMAKRHVGLDYELKSVAAGLLQLSLVKSPFETLLQRDRYCSKTKKSEPLAVYHRFWFYPATPERPRFIQDGKVIEIVKPIQVQLLTEREFRDQNGVRQGAGEPDEDAKRFTQDVTKLIQSSPPPRYEALVIDFQIIEIALLLQKLNANGNILRYLLAEHTLQTVGVPRFVVGVFRHDSGSALCNAEIEESVDGATATIRVKRDIAQRDVTSRGGIGANILIDPSSFIERSGTLGDTAERFVSARPADEQAFIWRVR